MSLDFSRLGELGANRFHFLYFIGYFIVKVDLIVVQTFFTGNKLLSERRLMNASFTSSCFLTSLDILHESLDRSVNSYGDGL